MPSDEPAAPAVPDAHRGRTVPYGEWPSPIDASFAAVAGVRLEDVRMVDGRARWSESRPAERGRTVVADERGDVLPPGWDARTRVHEYGGGAWLVDGDGGLVFSEFSDQRLYRAIDGEVVPLTPPPPSPAGLRYADGVVSPAGDEVWCVREMHVDGTVRRDLVAVPRDGRAADDPALIRVLGGTTHFLSSPRPSPDGKQLAWLGWDHPDMPWDSTRLFVADVLDTGSLGDPRTVIGGQGESLVQPEWLDNNSLLVVSDRSGWWNLYRLRLDVPSGPMPLCPSDEEFGFPAWTFGNSSHARLADGRLAVLHGRGQLRLAVVDLASGRLEDLDLPFTSSVSCHLAAHEQQVAMLAGGPGMPLSVVVVDIEPGGSGCKFHVVRTSTSQETSPAVIPQPVLRQLTGPDGRVVYCYDYPPRNVGISGPADDRPPYVLTVHGGPTGHSETAQDLTVAFFTSRGIGVVDVQYSGSSGFGRAYRERLRGQWGVLEVEDCIAVAEQLGAAGLADPDRIAIRGGSAGGWTVLAALTRTSAFAAGVSYYGVADALSLAETTHDFESRYLDGLIGPLPEARRLYEDRSPLSHLDGLSCPVLLLQGQDDPVVPPAQAEALVAALKARDVPYAYIAFEGESHGFRRATTRAAALEAELSFYGQVLGFTPPGVPVLPLQGTAGGSSSRDLGGA